MELWKVHLGLVIASQVIVPVVVVFVIEPVPVLAPEVEPVAEPELGPGFGLSLSLTNYCVHSLYLILICF